MTVPNPTHIKSHFEAIVFPTCIEANAALTPPEVVDPTIEDAWGEEHMNDYGSYGLYGTNVHATYSFTAKRGGILDRAKVFFQARPAEAIDPPLGITCSIYDTPDPLASALPEGAALAVSEQIDTSTLVRTPDIGPVEFAFTGVNQIQLVKDKVYCLVFDLIGTPPNPSYDAYRFGFHWAIVPPRHDGNFGYGPAGQWQYQATYFDMIFYVHSLP